MWNATHVLSLYMACCEHAADLGKVPYERAASRALAQMRQKPASLVFWYLASGSKAAKLFIIGVAVQRKFPPALLCAERLKARLRCFPEAKRNGASPTLDTNGSGQ